jgi:hypothetical protein|tara:strand:+ start:8274 stop:8654 length:381 start_codon:yes stop_codon:yes gene_type:complete
MVDEKLGSLGVGTKEVQLLEPAEVVISGYEVEEIDLKGKIKEIVVLKCDHPGKEDAVKISKIKFERKGKLETKGFWVSLDEDGLISKRSSLAELLRKVGVKSLSGLENQKVGTVQDENGYLVIKGY